MTSAERPLTEANPQVAGGRLAAAFAVRQLGMLALISILILATLFFFNLYRAVTWEQLWGMGSVTVRFVTLPLIVVLVFGYVLFIGLLFALVPSERSFQFFFYGIAFALFAANYDHTILDWVFQYVFRGSFRVPDTVSVIKIALGGGILSCVILMHYNILSDDFTKRMVRRGIPTEEVARIRPAMMASLFPLLTVCGFIAVGLGMVGEFSALVFQNHGLFQKVEILLLGIFGVAIGFLLRSIIKELYQGGGEEEEDLSDALPPTRDNE